MEIPAISVIIPLYNTERYIAECLDSILNQTFQDFEVIVVDDCSTDKSPAIVQSYEKKFDGRLKLSRMSENSGCAPLPRNKGLNISRGEYIYFVDADDVLTQTALEEMYTLAEDFDADVVYCERNYDMAANGSNVRLVCRQYNAIDKPTFLSDDLAERVSFILQADIWGTPWCKLVQRNLLVENEITFQKVRPCDDHLWTLDVFFFAKRFLRVPNAIYLWRKTETSATRGNKNFQQNMNLWLNSAILGLKGLDKSLGKLKFFKENLQARYNILNYFLKKMFFISAEYRSKLQPFEIYEAIRQEYSKDLGKYDVLIPALCALTDENEKYLLLYRNQIETLDFKVQQLNNSLGKAHKRITEAEKVERQNNLYISELESFVTVSQKQIAELKNEISRLKT